MKVHELILNKLIEIFCMSSLYRTILETILEQGLVIFIQLKYFDYKKGTTTYDVFAWIVSVVLLTFYLYLIFIIHIKLIYKVKPY
jgi:hypothetical protein